MGYKFEAQKVREDIVGWIRNIQKQSGLRGVVIGISGGKDSTIAAALCAEAIGAENVIGVMMPNGEQKDLNDARKVVETLGIKAMTINIGYAYREVLSWTNVALSPNHSGVTPEAAINIAPRIRMTTLYAIAQSMGGGYRVCGTGNLSERTLGYFTKWGDGAYDFNPLANLTSLEVVAIGDTYNHIPYELVHKIPDDGLSGMSDEEKLGVTYKYVHDYLRTACTNKEAEEKIRRMEFAGRHKAITGIPMYHVPLQFLYE